MELQLIILEYRLRVMSHSLKNIFPVTSAYQVHMNITKKFVTVLAKPQCKLLLSYYKPSTVLLCM